MSSSWATIILLAVMTMLLRASGPLIIGQRKLPHWTLPLISVLPAALLAALIVTQVLTANDRIVLDERLAGLAAAAAVLGWRRQALIPAMAAAAAVVALLRALS